MEPPFYVLKSYFMISKFAAKTTFLDIMFYLLMKVLYYLTALYYLRCCTTIVKIIIHQDPDGHLPNLFNDEELTDRELTLFLRNINHRQSPGVQRLVSAL